MGAYFHDLRHVCEEKWERVDRACREAAIGLLVAGDLATVRYLTGYLPYLTLTPAHGQPAVYVVGRGRPILYPFWFYEAFARARFPWIEIRRLPSGDEAIAEEIVTIQRQMGPQGARLGWTGLTPRLEEALQRRCGPDAMLEADALLAELRAVKTPGEVGIVREAVRIAEAGMAEGLAGLRAGRTECEVAADAEAAMRRLGTESHAIVLRGANAALLQEVSTDDPFLAGEVALVDLGCYRRGYRAEFARTALVGSRLDGRRRHLAEVVVRALEEGGALLRPGVTSGEVARKLDQVVRDAGYGAYAHPYPMGHGLGVTGSEYPHIAADSQVVLCEHMVMNLEPGIFIPEEGTAIRIEDTWLITQGAPELLTSRIARVM